MNQVLMSVGILLAGAVLALLTSKLPRICTFLGAGSAVAACAFGVLPAWNAFNSVGPYESQRWNWSMPEGADFIVQLDVLSALFLLPVLFVSGLSAIYGSQYLFAARYHKQLGPPWFFYNSMVASMILVLLARNAVLFLIAWEVMSLAAFFLITFEDEKPGVLEAGRIFLIATHLGTAFLLVFFILLGQRLGSLNFDKAPPDGIMSSATSSLLFVLMLVGFGTKAGLMPFHVWLPEAHPVAPSHVSAVLSAVMIKTGIYGLLRFLAFLGPPSEWWAWVLIVLGLVSGILGALCALAQRDLKRLLAYSSVDNIGIIALGMGIGLLGVQTRNAALSVLGFGGALLHVVNHSLFKGLLFLGAGAVQTATGTRDMEKLGGLLKKMPRTALGFLVGALAISGLPPLNGFMGEFLIYLAAFREEIRLTNPMVSVPALIVIASLAMIGGLAMLCFVKAYCIVFLGEPRTQLAQEAKTPGFFMWVPQLVLALACLLTGMFASRVLGTLGPVLTSLTKFESDVVQGELQEAAGLLSHIAMLSAALLAMIAVLGLFRWFLLMGREVGSTNTWACGFSAPTPRLQYTGSSLVQPVTSLLAMLLPMRTNLNPPQGYFPQSASLSTETFDFWQERLYKPVFALIGWALSKLRWLQHGLTHLYVLYIAVTVLVLLIWFLGMRA
jgi:hydrogenase-4 component B